MSLSCNRFAPPLPPPSSTPVRVVSSIHVLAARVPVSAHFRVAFSDDGLKTADQSTPAWPSVGHESVQALPRACRAPSLAPRAVARAKLLCESLFSAAARPAAALF
eukprot:5304854-Pleurochrysis_carterae.AAC.1